MSQTEVQLIKNDAVVTADVLDDAITFAKMQNTSNGVRFLGKHDSGGGLLEEITAAQARTMLNVADGATAGGGKVIQVLSANSNAFITSSGSFQQSGCAKSITMTHASNKILAIASGTMNNSAAGSGGGISIFRGSTNLAHSNDVMASYFGEDDSNNIDIGTTIHVLDAPGAGTHTYEVYVRAFSGGQRFAYRDTGVITLLELDFS